MFEVGCLHTLFQIVHSAQMLFPAFVNHRQGDLPFQSIGQLAAFGLDGFVEIGQHLYAFLTIGEGHYHVFDMTALREADILNTGTACF